MAGPTRRDVIASGAAMAAAGLLGAPAVVQATGAAPNVLFIAIDDLNDWIEPLGGYPGVSTPNLSRLAALGRTYLNAHTAAPACGPARGAAVFGVAPHRSGFYTMQEQWERNTVLAALPSLPRTFRDHGYRTFGTGKILHGPYNNPVRPVSVDPAAWDVFEFCDGANEFCRAIDDLDDEDVDSIRKVKSIEFGPGGHINSMPDVVRARWIADQVLSSSHDKPFFASIGLIKPHLPFIIPHQFFDLYLRPSLRYPPGVLDRNDPLFKNNRDVEDLPYVARRLINRTYGKHKAIFSSGLWKDIIHAYLAAISFTDYCIGLVLDALLLGPNASNTLVVLWSDHGWQLGEKLAWQKFTLWERATRIPMMIAGPGIVPGITMSPASSLDLYPTLMDVVFKEVPTHLDGVSLKRNLLENKAMRRPVLTTWMMKDADPAIEGPHFSVRSQHRRLIAYRDGSYELYDHRSDPFEWRNLYRPDEPSVARIVASMRAVVPAPLLWSARNG